MFILQNKISRNVLLSCDHGLMIVNRFDSNKDKIGHGQLLLDHGNVSTVESSACFEVIRHIPSPVIFDVGANIGTFTTWISKSFPNGKIYAFEPQREVFQILCGNIAINNLYNVYTYNIALGNKNCYIEFNTPNYLSNSDFGTFSLVKENISTISNREIVQLQKIDTFCSMFKVDKIDLLKIDVEGMDLEVLFGSENIIKTFRPALFVEFFDNHTSIINEIKNFLEKYNYEYTLINNNVLCVAK